MAYGMSMYIRAEFSPDFLKLFQGEYEKHVLKIMNLSKSVFPGTYQFVGDQSHGECDYIEIKTGKKFDAKLPFTKQQIELLTDGRKHQPKIIDWISSLHDEAAEYRFVTENNEISKVTETKLYSIMKNQIKRDKKDEEIVFFLPFPISLSIRGSAYLQFATDFLHSIYDRLTADVDLAERGVYAIYPTVEKDIFAVRDLSKYGEEFITCKELGQFFAYEATKIQINQKLQ